MDFHPHAVRQPITDGYFFPSDEGANDFSFPGSLPEEGMIIGKNPMISGHGLGYCLGSLQSIPARICAENARFLERRGLSTVDKGYGFNSDKFAGKDGGGKNYCRNS